MLFFRITPKCTAHRRARLPERLAALLLAMAVAATALPVSVTAAEISDSDIESSEIVVTASDLSPSDVPLNLSPWECAPAQCLAALLVDETNNHAILYEKAAHERIYPASTTKMMTALLVIEALERGELTLDEELQADAPILSSVIYDASHVHPRIKIDEKLSVEDYLYCVMIESDCVCCNILGRRVSGSIEEFVRLMNTRAAELGCEDTNFVNTHGYPADDHYTTAWSLYLIAREAMRHDLFRKIVSTNLYTIQPNKVYKKERHLKNTNWLLGMPEKPAVKYDADYTFADCIGIKTGYSSQAGSCLVSCAERGGRKLFCVVLGAWAIKLEDGTTRRRSFSESKRLLEWGFDNFDVHTCIKQGTVVDQCPVKDGGYTTSVKVAPQDNVSAFLPVGIDYQSLDAEVELYTDALQAPFPRGTAAGKLRLLHDGQLVAETELVTTERADLPTDLELLMMRLESTSEDVLRYQACTVLIILLIFAWIITSMARGAARRREQRAYAMERKRYEYDNRYRR